MTFIRRAAVATGTAALLVLSLSACGDDDEGDGGSDAPAGAPQEEFCDAFNAVFADIASIQTQPTAEQWSALQGKVEKLGEVGTPEDISDDNRDGYEVLVKAVTETDYDDNLDFTAAIPGASESEQAKATSFVSYAATLCTDLDDLPSEAIPTE